MTIIYCRSICSEFRRPVDCLYPDIMVTYLKTIKKPMDLGTILYNCLRERYKSLDDFKHDVQLVFENALTFNAGAPLMEAISQHIDSFVGALFEEAFNKPYRLLSDVASPPDHIDGIQISENDVNFKVVRLSRRRYRVALVKHMSLNSTELSLLSMNLELVLVQFQAFKGILYPVINRIKDIVKQRKTSGNSDKTDEIVSLSSLLDSLLRTTCVAASNDVSDVNATKTVVSNMIATSNQTLKLSQPAILNVLYETTNISSNLSLSYFLDSQVDQQSDSSLKNSKKSMTKKEQAAALTRAAEVQAAGIDPVELIHPNLQILSQYVAFLEVLDNAIGLLHMIRSFS